MLNSNALTMVLALSALPFAASAANVSASMTVTQADGMSWVQNLSGLVVTDAQNNFSMVQGTGTTGYFQNGQFVSAAQATSLPDYWQWTTDSNGASAWSWHSAQTLDGTSPLSTTASNPWDTSVKLQNAAGHGDPDLIYAVSAINNNNLTQTYTFVFGEAIAPVVSGANITFADITGGLTSRSGGSASITPVNASGIQQFELSADNGTTFVNAGVDVGLAASTAATAAYGVYAATNPDGPMGQSWNYMRLVSSFTLSGKSAASLTGFASITPVPEPGSEYMLLVGVGLVGTIMRRRRNLW